MDESEFNFHLFRNNNNTDRDITIYPKVIFSISNHFEILHQSQVFGEQLFNTLTNEQKEIIISSRINGPRNFYDNFHHLILSSFLLIDSSAFWDTNTYLHLKGQFGLIFSTIGGFQHFKTNIILNIIIGLFNSIQIVLDDHITLSYNSGYPLFIITLLQLFKDKSTCVSYNVESGFGLSYIRNSISFPAHIICIGLALHSDYEFHNIDTIDEDLPFGTFGLSHYVNSNVLENCELCVEEVNVYTNIDSFHREKLLMIQKINNIQRNTVLFYDYNIIEDIDIDSDIEDDESSDN